MSQWGAHGMAARGVGYQDILTHYYSGTAVQGQSQPALRIWLAGDGSSSPGTTLTAGGDVQLIVAGSIVATATNGQTIRVTLQGGHFYIAVNNTQVAGPVGGGSDNVYVEYAAGHPQHTGAGGPILLDKTGHRYAYGAIEISPPSSGGLRIVLVDMDMQHYLYGLGEVPSSWPREALRAQAIAARTYGKEKVDRLGNNRSDCACGLLGTTGDQNYVGWDKESASGGANWVSAVNDTHELVVTYQGKAIQAFYFSSSGGYTENSENVFVQSLAYLRGVSDPDDKPDNPNFAWQRDYTREELERWLSRASDTNTGTLDRIEFLQPLGVSGRVIKPIDSNHGGVRIVGSSGTKQVSGDRFRSVVNGGIAAEGGGLSRELLSSLMRTGWLAYPAAFTGGVFVAAGVMDGSGQDRIVTGADAGGGPHVALYAADGGVVHSGFYAYNPSFTGGVRVAACNLLNDGGTEEIVTGPGPGGGPHVRAFTAGGGALATSFMAYGSFGGGVYVACGDLDGDGVDEIVTGAGPGGGPHVRVFKADGTPVGGGFFAYASGFKGGVRVAVAHLNGANQPASIVTAAGPGGGPHVRVFKMDGTPVGGGFFAYAPSFTGGAYVGAGDMNGDGTDEIITGAGESGGAHVRVVDPSGADVKPGFFIFDTGNDHGARVAGGHFGAPGVVGGAGTGSPSYVRVVTF